MFDKENLLWDFLIENSIATEEALTLLTNINGYSVETLEDALYCLTGYRSIDQLEESEK
jgi:hypothetical protein